MKSPFRNTINLEYNNTPHVQIRWEKTKAFLKKCDIASGLDIGDRTPFTEQLESHYNCSFENTTIDLDEGKLTGEYDIITAFEIIEHLFNPLHLLTEISCVLKKNAILYLSLKILINSSKIFVFSESRLPVGSSAKINFGLFTSERKKAIR